MAALSGPRRDSERGFSLLELVVATTLLLLALALGAGLLIESLRQTSAAGRTLREGDDAGALHRLRSDLRGLAPAVPATLGWESGPLVLLEEERAVAWALEGEHLVRAEVGAAAPHGGEDVGVSSRLLREVVAFRWRVEPPAWVEVEIVRRVPTHTPAVRLASAQWQRRGETLEATRVGAARRSGWR